MAGSSAVLIIVAAPEFYRSAGAHVGGMSMGAADNRMLEVIASDVAEYAGNNR